MLVIPARGAGAFARGAPAAVHDRTLAARLALVLFPLALWAVATVYFGGHLGRLSDDYQMLRRDPVTGALDLPATQAPDRPYFLRPVFLFVAHNLITLGYGHEWIVHVLMALVHGGTALLAYTVLRRTGVGALAAASGALLFLVLPQTHEAVFWMSAMGTELSLATFLVLALLVVRCTRLGPAALASFFVLAFLVPCWNEQSAAAIPALPLLALAARPADQPFGRTLRRALVVTGVCLAAVALYLALLISTAPPGQRGSPSSLISLAEAGTRVQAIGRSAWRWSFGEIGQDVVTGGLVRAAQDLFTLPGIAALFFLGATGAWFASRWTGNEPRRAEPRRAGAPRLAWLALFGLAMATLALVPALLIRDHPLTSRQCAVPVAGLLFVMGSLFEGLRRVRWPRAARWVPGLAGVVVVTGASTLAVSMVGVQGLFRDNARLDRRVAEQLRALVPEPERGTVFVTLDSRVRAARTGRTYFDAALPLAWYHHYAMGPLTREVFARADIAVSPLNPWCGPTLRNFTAESVVVPCALAGGVQRLYDGKSRVPWAETVPFVIDERGSVSLVDRVWIERANGNDLEITDTGVPDHARDGRSFALRDPADKRSLALTGWRNAGNGGESRLERRQAFGLVHPVLGLATLPARLALELDPYPGPTRLVFRVASAADAPASGEIVLRCSFDSEPDVPLAQQTFTVADLRAQGRWVPFVVELGPLQGVRTVQLEVLGDQDSLARSVFVTPGSRCLVGKKPQLPSLAARRLSRMR